MSRSSVGNPRLLGHDGLATAKAVLPYSPTRPFGYWGGTFSDDEVERALASRRPLTLDMALPGRCRNSCEYCGYYGVNPTGKLAPTEIQGLIDAFAKLGGKSIKILGEGEPLLRPDILDLLAEISSSGMIPVLFTCGDALGDENLCEQTLGLSPHEVVERLSDIGCTVVLKFDSWQQDDMVGRAGYTEARERALDLLIAAGLNRTYPSRLGFGIVLLKRNYAEVSSIFRFALERNIYPLVCPLMPIGRSSAEEFRDRVAPARSETRSLRAHLVKIREEYGVKDGRLSDFPGGLPCDVSRCGMYVDDQGKALICESDDSVGNIRTVSLADLWAYVDAAKDRKYRAARRRGLCFPKRVRGIV